MMVKLEAVRFKKVHKKIHVTIDYDGNDWELFDGSSIKAFNVAQQLNKSIEFAINHMELKGAELWQACMATFDLYSEYGSSDTEPRQHLADLLNYIFCFEKFSRWGYE